MYRNLDVSRVIFYIPSVQVAFFKATVISYSAGNEGLG